MRTIAIINQKGGCGKTTSAINLAACFAARGVRTLLVDMDPQSHCAAGLGIPEQSIDQDVSSALLAPANAPLARDRFVWQSARNLDLLPSTMMLAAVESQRGGFADQPDKEKRLKSVIERLARTSVDPETSDSRYDLCIIDCPPSIGLLSYNALAAAREILIPVETSFFSLQGAQKQIQTVRSMGRRVGARLHPRLFATMHAPEQKLSRDLLNELRARFEDRVIPLAVRYDPALKEAASMGQPVEGYAPQSGGAEDYRALTEWLMEHASIERGDDTPDAPDVDHGSATPGRDNPGRPFERAPAMVGTAPSADPGARAVEIAQRARLLAEQRVPMPRSLMPHRPVAIEVIDDRVVTPQTLETRQPLEHVRHLVGVRRVTGGVLFVQPLSIGERVFVAGTFNDWSGTAHELRANESLGIFEAHIELSPGEHEYKLVVDGRWQLDEHNNRLCKNPSGHVNNLIEPAPAVRGPSDQSGA